MHYLAALGLLDCEGFDSYSEVVIEATSQEEAETLAYQAVMASVGDFWVMGQVSSVKQIQVCLMGIAVPHGQKVTSPFCGENKFLVPTGRVLYRVEELVPLTCEGRWEWISQWVESPLYESNCP